MFQVVKQDNGTGRYYEDSNHPNFASAKRRWDEITEHTAMCLSDPPISKERINRAKRRALIVTG